MESLPCRFAACAVCAREQTRCCLRCSGFVKNWWVGVETLHNLFVKEHNYLCGMLREVRHDLCSCVFVQSRTGLSALADVQRFCR